jgi:hypothetical protein
MGKDGTGKAIGGDDERTMAGATGLSARLPFTTTAVPARPTAVNEQMSTILLAERPAPTAPAAAGAGGVVGREGAR